MFFAKAHMDRAPRRTYLLGGAVVLIFCAVNIWVAIDHLGIQNRLRAQTDSAMNGIRLLAEQRRALFAARPDNGAIELQMMRKAGVNVPESFIRNERFASPWGSSQIMRQGDLLVWDFYEIAVSDCTQLLEESGTIAGIIRVAASSAAADEKSPPLTWDTAAKECRRSPPMARLIMH
jgi:hypothetical protein